MPKYTYTLKQLRKHVELLHARIGTCDISDVNEVRRQYFAAKLELETRTRTKPFTMYTDGSCACDGEARCIQHGVAQ